MTNAFSYLVEALGTLVLFFFIMRLLLQLSRANFREPFAQGVVQLTNWLVMPLRRVLPALGKLDTASLVACLLIAALVVALQTLVLGFGLPDPLSWLRAAFMLLLNSVLWVYTIAILIGVVLSWVAPGGYSPVHGLIDSITAPVLNPIRRVLPPLVGFDFTPVVALIAIGFLRALIF
jgi:YggT family protein